MSSDSVEPLIDGMLVLRISDNVLDELDWPMWLCVMADDVIIQQRVIRTGAYSRSNSLPGVGDTMTDIIKWSSYDSTGEHPETYHRVGVVDYKFFGWAPNRIEAKAAMKKLNAAN